MSDATAPVHLVQRLLNAAQRAGLDVGSLLRRAGISERAVRSRRARVTLEQLADLTRELWRETDDELFGLGRERIPLGT